MSIYFECEDVKLPELNFEHVKKILKGQVRGKKFKLGLINYIFCSDDFLLDLNIKFLDHDYYTDVITFDYSDGLVVSGDVYISVERVINNSVIFGQSFEDELVRVISHGLLHLLGLDDKTEEDVRMMRKAENILLEKYLSLIV